MDNKDRKILEIIQEGISITPRPYQDIGERTGLEEKEVLFRIERMKKRGIIRHLGFLFNHRRLSFTSTLIAMKVPEEKLDEVSKIVNTYSEITHNYSRDNEYNLWFVLVVENKKRIQSILAEITAKTGINNILELPAQRQFKLKVNINPNGGLRK